jgi:amino acid transporter
MGKAGIMTDQLKRKLGVPLLVFYGVGIMVGAGIYVLVGAAAGAAGIYAPLAFLLAGLVALPTAASYAELSARIPKSAGEAAYLMRAFHKPVLAQVVGLITVVTGTIAAAVVLQGGVGYLQKLIPWDTELLIVLMGGFLTLVAIAGVVESLALAAIFTIVEVAGLLIVSYVGLTGPTSVEWVAVSAMDAQGGLQGLAFAGVLAFFAFIGFEDLVNMAEETREPERTLPRAIYWSLGITTVLYILVSIAAVRTVGIDQLGVSRQPLALVFEVATGKSSAFLAVIAVAAATNGVLAQIILAARVLFGLGENAPWLSVFTHAHPRFGTPVLATVLSGVAVILAALYLPLVSLAEITSVLLLAIFASMNLALIVIKRQEPEATYKVSAMVPWAGLILSGVAFFAALIWV